MDGDDQNDDEDQDLHEGGDDFDNNDIKPMDFDIDNMDSEDSHSNGNDGGGDGDLAIFDFNEDVMIRPNKAKHIYHEALLKDHPLETFLLNKVFDVTIMLLR